LPILQKGRITVEWTWWCHRNANNKGLSSPPKFFSKLDRGSRWSHVSEIVLYARELALSQYWPETTSEWL